MLGCVSMGTSQRAFIGDELLPLFVGEPVASQAHIGRFIHNVDKGGNVGKSMGSEIKSVHLVDGEIAMDSQEWFYLVGSKSGWDNHVVSLHVVVSKNESMAHWSPRMGDFSFKGEKMKP